MNLDDQTLRELVRPAGALPAPVRPLGLIQRRAAQLRRRRRLAQAGGTAVLTAALALGVTQVGLPRLGDRGPAGPAAAGTVDSGRWTVADATGVIFAPDRALSGPPVAPIEFFDLSEPCAQVPAVTIAYHAEDGVVRDGLRVWGPFAPDNPQGPPPDPGSFAADQRPTVRSGSVDGHPATILDYPDTPGTTAGHWRDSSGRWWQGVVTGFTSARQRVDVLTGLRMSGRAVRAASIARTLDVRPEPADVRVCRGEQRNLAFASTFGKPVIEQGGWGLGVGERRSRYDSFLTRPGARITEVQGRRAVWFASDTPMPPEGGEPPHHNLLWLDAAGREFEIVADPTMTLQRALRIAESVHKVGPAEAGVPATDLANPIRKK